MKIFIYYQIAGQPWGGGNSFLKAFRNYCLKNHVELAGSINERYDILFFNAAHKGPGKYIDLTELLKQKFYGKSGPFKKFIRGRKPKILVYRSDGFRCFYAKLERNMGDCIQRSCLQIADHIIFQNEFSLRMTRSKQVGYNNDNYTIIHSGVNHDLFRMKESGFWDGRRKLRVFSANWSSNINKGYSELADFSELEGIEVSFCGNWPEKVPWKKVRLVAPKSQQELAKEYTKYDIFLHVSKYDASPNVCLEAVSCGLPIIYHSTSGIGEIIDNCGIQFNDENPGRTLHEIRLKYDGLVENIKKRRSFFSMDRCAGEYLKVFESLLS